MAQMLHIELYQISEDIPAHSMLSSRAHNDSGG
jgi:hypothetical protein